jgi:hypothetical protein
MATQQLGFSRCTCGHVGDVSTRPDLAGKGEPNVHAGILGHGYCMVEGCGCDKFKERLPGTAVPMLDAWIRKGALAHLHMEPGGPPVTNGEGAAVRVFAITQVRGADISLAGYGPIVATGQISPAYGTCPTCNQGLHPCKTGDQPCLHCDNEHCDYSSRRRRSRR